MHGIDRVAAIEAAMVMNEKAIASGADADIVNIAHARLALHQGVQRTDDLFLLGLRRIFTRQPPPAQTGMGVRWHGLEEVYR